jgi:hypothetical protein
MARPRIMDDAKIISLALDRTDLEIVEREKEGVSFSSYIRSLIREQVQRSNKNQKEETITLQKELRKIKADLDVYKRKEAAVTKIRADTLADLGVAYMNYLKQTHPTEHYRNNWINGRCKSAGISSIDFLAYVGNQEAMNNVHSMTCRGT